MSSSYVLCIMTCMWELDKVNNTVGKLLIDQYRCWWLIDAAYIEKKYFMGILSYVIWLMYSVFSLSWQKTKRSLGPKEYDLHVIPKT